MIVTAHKHLLDVINFPMLLEWLVAFLVRSDICMVSVAEIHQNNLDSVQSKPLLIHRKVVGPTIPAFSGDECQNVGL